MTVTETQSAVSGEVISRYSRAQAIEDGVLVDLMQAETVKAVKEAGFRYPLAMTATAWNGTIGLFGKWQMPGIDDGHGEVLMLPAGQNVQGRLWDVLWMLKQAIRRQQAVAGCVMFSVLVSGRRVELKSLCGPEDEGEPVITIMLPSED